MNEETVVRYEGGNEEWQYAWNLAGERYLPACLHTFRLFTTWTIQDMLTAAEHKGMKTTTLLAKRMGPKGTLVTVVADVEHQDRKALAVFRNGNHISMFGADAEVPAALAAILMDGMPAPEPPVKPLNAIYVNFSYNTEDGDRSATRAITAPSWAQIKDNYPAEVRGKLAEFIAGGPENLRGHLGILHGPAGSGKSTFIRAICKEWAGKARVSYIVDTETFFTNPGYLLNTILDERDGWHIIVCEDAEDFLTRDAKTRNNVGQAISRILNVGDGMLGQGLRVLILFTTNAKRMELDDAITRKGRCFLDVELPKFGRDEATGWLVAHGKTRQQAGRETNGREWLSLAEMYDITGEVPVTEVVMPRPDVLEEWESALLEDF